MRETRTLRSMSGDGERGTATAPVLDSTRISRYRSDNDNATLCGTLHLCWLIRISVRVCEAPGVDQRNAVLAAL